MDLATIGFVLCDGTVVSSTVKRPANDALTLAEAKRIVIKGSSDGVCVGPVSYGSMAHYKAAMRQAGTAAYLHLCGGLRRIV